MKLACNGQVKNRKSTARAFDLTATVAFTRLALLLKLPLALGLVEGLGFWWAVAQCFGFACLQFFFAFFVAKVHKQPAQREADGAADHQKNNGGCFHKIVLSDVVGGVDVSLSWTLVGQKQ
jgi:hypothetical protein